MFGWTKKGIKDLAVAGQPPLRDVNCAIQMGKRAALLLIGTD